MKRSFRKFHASLIMLLAVILMAAGCGTGNSGGKETSSASPAGSDAPSTATASGANSAPTAWNGIDISQEVKLKMVLLGEKPADFDLVYEEVNKL
ncbi:hypothetical protein [Cohnella hongkongensis]|uniref:Sugar ABC transporter substrate-binding protein n=1 Tax=Cohnella hongkongensis TaxID=178337 RepID=A0ABV9F8I6_9BACL